MRFYVLTCLKGASATVCTLELWAFGVIDAFARAREQGYWPLAVERSGWNENETD